MNALVCGLAPVPLDTCSPPFRYKADGAAAESRWAKLVWELGWVRWLAVVMRRRKNSFGKIKKTPAHEGRGRFAIGYQLIESGVLDGRA